MSKTTNAAQSAKDRCSMSQVASISSGTVVSPVSPSKRAAKKTQPIKVDKSTSKGKGEKIVKTTSKQKAVASKDKAKTPAKETTKGKGTTPAKKGKTSPTPAVGKPAKDRRASFYLSDDQLTELKAEYKESKVIPIPYNSGAYRSFLLALLELKADKPHPFKAVKEKMREIMNSPETKVEGQTQWQRFSNKDGHSDIEENCLNVDGKIHQNAEVLQRVNGESNTPYGMKLLQVGQKVLKSKGMVVDVLKGKDGKERLYRLNTNANVPVNEFKRQRAE